MRLKSLKLSGFKSFVDTGYFKFSSNLVGIVGPNGCGKSNTIDAVRWVMGERSAKHLRGDSMVDVIFNGAKNRKPVGKATVELLFDNSSGRITGEYATYNDISVKRSVSRDGQSDYFLNNTKVRRRDVMDLFAGTGLGTRSYAIIEQGTISRFIEAKPEEIRNMLEEAAGVSQYKERRRETENRIKHTKENLARIEDLSDEISKNIKKLTKQANIAKKYKDLKQQQKLVNAQLLATKWHEQSVVNHQWQNKINQATVHLESKRSELQKNSTELEKLYQQKNNDLDTFNQAQSVFNQTQVKLRELEQNEKIAKTQTGQISVDLQDIDLNKSAENLTQDKILIAKLSEWLIHNKTDLIELEQQKNATKKAWQSKETDWEMCQKTLQNKTDEIANLEKDKLAFEVKINQTTIRQVELNNRLNDLEEESNGLRISDETTTLKVAYKESEQELSTLKVQQEKTRLAMIKSRENIQQFQLKLNKKRQYYQECIGELSSLKTLRKNSSTKYSDTQNIQWLDDNSLNDKKRLASLIRVDLGFELACEMVLGDFLMAICTDDEQPPKNFKTKISTTILQKISANALITNPRNNQLLSNNIQSDYDLNDILSGVLVADSLKEAMSIRKTLLNDESVITKDGVWFGKNWIKISIKNNDTDNILERERTIRDLQKIVNSLEKEIENLEKEARSFDENQIILEQTQESTNEQFNKKQSEVSDLKIQQSVILAKNQQIDHRKVKITQESNGIRQTLKNLTLTISDVKIKQQNTVLIFKNSSDKLAQLNQKKVVLHDGFIKAKVMFENSQEAFYNLSVRVQTKQAELDTTEKHIKRSAQQLDGETKRQTVLEQRRLDVNQILYRLKSDISTTIDTQIQQTLAVKSAKQKFNDIEYQYQQNVEFSQSLAALIKDFEQKLNEFKMASQQSLVLQQTFSDQVNETEFELENLLDTVLTEDGTIKNIQQYQRLAEDISIRIQQFGQINFTAVAECQSQSDRKIYIDKQVIDLKEALDTLEHAIIKIDRETKDRFKKTFDLVNAGVQRIFPELFGGGKAYLQLRSDNLLETGVTIMAQPPGKRNSSIHLLSGGEKALTAVALVFAIFELNPAPFCMLDEVDAPLDDANVIRFCKMVRKMSDKVQFIFVTHNKITMELSEQLLGVTMQESGVSRLVGVDLKEAVQMSGA